MCRRALSQLCARSSEQNWGCLLLPASSSSSRYTNTKITTTLHQHSQVFRVFGHRSRAATPRQIL